MMIWNANAKVSNKKEQSQYYVYKTAKYCISSMEKAKSCVFETDSAVENSYKKALRKPFHDIFLWSRDAI